MKTPTTKQLSTIIIVTLMLFACNQKPIDPNSKLDKVLIPEGFVESKEMSLDAQTRIDELKLRNSTDQFYYLKFKKGPVTDEKQLIFPQKELKIEFLDRGSSTNEIQKYEGVIVKKIKAGWTDEIFMYYDKKAEPNGGMAAFKNRVANGLKYPKEAKNQRIEGKVFVQFIVDKNGYLIQIQAVKGLGVGCDEEAVRFIQEEPQWNPAKIMGKDVASRVLLPIVFKLD